MIDDDPKNCTEAIECVNLVVFGQRKDSRVTHNVNKFKLLRFLQDSIVDMATMGKSEKYKYIWTMVKQGVTSMFHVAYCGREIIKILSRNSIPVNGAMFAFSNKPGALANTAQISIAQN